MTDQYAIEGLAWPDGSEPGVHLRLTMRSNPVEVVPADAYRVLLAHNKELEGRNDEVFAAAHALHKQVLDSSNADEFYDAAVKLDAALSAYRKETGHE